MQGTTRYSSYRRRKTREVMIGAVGVGGDNPIRVQSMTTPRTADVEATVAQIVRLVEAGCEIVRVTVPSTADAEALPRIRAALNDRGIRVPLIADIHFSPAAALMAVEHVEKVRINPGNYADTKRFKVWEYTDAEYRAELERIEQRFKPLVMRARELGVSMRIGTNHGSLSDRILNRYGDTPLGMVESALEFVRICERHSYRDLVLSMKSSNPMVMIQAYRLLAERMAAEGMHYPFHLGVTEAGDGEDGRIKSAIGIGSLLEDGIGDTIRVSLTEDPVAEVPVAFRLVEKFNALLRNGIPAASTGAPVIPPPSLSTYRRRPSARIAVGGITLGGQEPVRVESLLTRSLRDAAAIDAETAALSGIAVPPDTRAEVLEVDLGAPGLVPAYLDFARRFRSRSPSGPALSARVDLPSLDGLSDGILRQVMENSDRLTLQVPGPVREAEGAVKRLASACPNPQRALCLETSVRGDSDQALPSLVSLAERWRDLRGGEPLLALDVAPELSPVLTYRHLAKILTAAGLPAPLLLVANPALREEDPLLFTSAYLGSLLCDGIGDAVRVEASASSPADSLRLAFNILQGTRLRLFKTEFISCPSCGRTQFDLEETTRRIKSRTSHLKGIKIAIMGCIVNGPGEMADADFGYVGWGPDKVSLFVGKDLVEKDIPYADADERLVRLIQERGKWVDPAPAAASLPAASKRD